MHFMQVNRKQVPPRTWQGGHGCAGRDDGGTTFRFQIFRRRRGGTGVTFREVRLNQDFSNSIQNKVAGERKWLNFDHNFDQNKVFKKEMCRSKERSNQEEM